MRIAAIMATRGHPHRASGVIECARALASGNHDILFVVACDSDDPDTWLHFENWPNVEIDARSRPSGVAQCFNRGVMRYDADIYVTLGDDCFLGSLHWDEAIAMFAEEGRFRRELVAFSLDDQANPKMPTAPCASHEWIRLTGNFLDDRFPFWFSDLAFAETWAFVTGELLPILPVRLNQPINRPNPRLRDMAFWWDFYAWTRAERLATASMVRSDLGLLEPESLPYLIDVFELRDRLGKTGEVSNSTKPDDAYLAAYARAQRLQEAA